MTTVTVDLKDLETIVFATGAIKTIEGALATRLADPFVKPHLDYKAAHERLAEAMRNATRPTAGTVVGWDEPLTKPEIRELRFMEDALNNRNMGMNLPWVVISGEDKAALGETMSVYDRLAAKGCVQMGQCVTGVIWAGADRPELVPDIKGFAARMTHRGAAKLCEVEGRPVTGGWRGADRSY